MAVPDYQSLMLPLLRFAAQKNDEISTGEAVEVLTKELGLTDEDLKEMLPSGIQSAFVNRVGWASTFMIAWTVLLFWAAQKPVERKFIIPLTLYIVVIGLALTCLIISPIELIEIWSFQILVVIVPGTVIYVLTRDLKSPMSN